MIWKEIYYINLFYNELSTNISDVYSNGVTDLRLNDKWKRFSFKKENLGEDYFHIAESSKYLIESPPNYDYKNLIHIIEHNKLNYLASTSEENTAFSQAWYSKHQNDGTVNQTRNHLQNYFRNIIPEEYRSNNNTNISWTVFSQFKDLLKSKGYTKAYASLTDSSININCHCLAYMNNNFFPSMIKNTNFETENDYALSLLLSFIFKSALSAGKEIWIYIPSVRMRSLLKCWIEKNST